jgi:hypothetical protein
MVMIRLRRLAMMRGPLAVRTWERSCRPPDRTATRPAVRPRCPELPPANEHQDSIRSMAIANCRISRLSDQGGALRAPRAGTNQTELVESKVVTPGGRGRMTGI